MNSKIEVWERKIPRNKSTISGTKIQRGLTGKDKEPFDVNMHVMEVVRVYHTVVETRKRRLAIIGIP